MNIFEEVKYLITSFKKFVEIVEERHSPTTEEKSQKWMFRGHEKVCYKLIPSVGRLLGTPRFDTEEDVYKAEKIAFHNFEIQTYPQLKENNLLILLTVAQHHGLKTRLLDWTFSPFVALFFAVENLNGEDGAFFAFDTKKSYTNILRIKKNPFQIKTAAYQYIIAPAITRRITAQVVSFSCSENLQNL